MTVGIYPPAGGGGGGGSGGTAPTFVSTDNIYLSYGSTPVTTAAYVQILAATADESIALILQDTSGSMLAFATGAPGSEVIQFYVQAGGFSFQLNYLIAAGTRLSLKAVDTNATTGAFLATLLKAGTP